MRAASSGALFGDFAQFQFHAGGMKFGGGLADAFGDDLHGGGFGGLEDCAEFKAALGAHEGLADDVGLVAKFGGDLVDAGGDFGVDAAAVVEGAVDGAAGDAGEFGDLLGSDSHREGPPRDDMQPL